MSAQSDLHAAIQADVNYINAFANIFDIAAEDQDLGNPTYENLLISLVGASDYVSPAVFVSYLVVSSNLLTELRASSGAGIDNYNSLSSTTITKSGGLTAAQWHKLYDMTFTQTSPPVVCPVNPELARNHPAVYVQGLAYAVPMLAALQASAAARVALMGITAAAIPSTGKLTMQSQFNALYTQIFYNSTEVYQPHAADPAEAIRILILAGPMLAALRSNAAARSALQSITGQLIPASGALTVAQQNALYGGTITTIFGLIMNYDGSDRHFSNNPVSMMAGLVLLGPMIFALRANATARSALRNIYDDATISWTGALLEKAMNPLLSLIYKADYSYQTKSANPSGTMDDLTHEGSLLTQLKLQNHAGLIALQMLGIITFPHSGTPTPPQTDAFQALLYEVDGVTPTLAYTDPAQYTDDALHAAGIDGGYTVDGNVQLSGNVQL